MDEILCLLIDSHKLAHLLRCLEMILCDDLIHDTTDAAEYVDGRKMVLRGNPPREHDMSIQNGTNSISNRFIHVVTVNQYGVDTCD